VIRRLLALGATAVAGAAAIWLGLHTNPPPRSGAVANASAAPASSGALGALIAAPEWLNTQPLLAGDLRGKVILVNFWTYSCINSLRPLPYTRAWAEKYKDRGLVVIGVHTPEFAFEKDAANLRTALASLDVAYPVVIDNDYRIWREFKNNAWPGFYFIGADGRVRQHVSGEGDYDLHERLLQQLLAEASGAPAALQITAAHGEGVQAAPDEKNLRSPESYVGYGQASSFHSPGGVRQDTPTLYRAAPVLPLNRWSLAGVWTVGRESALLDAKSGSITHRFHARDLHLVLAPPAHGRPVRFRVRIDGAPAGADHGFDVDADGWGSVRDAKLYQLVRQTGPVRDRTFEIEFFDAGVRAYAFTFG
jgi:thiol-disulfide isomerase/thioredoxin